MLSFQNSSEMQKRDQLTSANLILLRITDEKTKIG